MTEKTDEKPHEDSWNVLTGSWLEVLDLNGNARACSPLDALKLASGIRCLAFASPLDVFGVHRFLLTLLYWKASEGGGVDAVRESLLNGETPQPLLRAVKGEASCFSLFDKEAPFLQDPSVRETNKQGNKSAGSLFAEFACGINVAHFHHADDKGMRLCLKCATLGMIRVVPWTQAGGAGLSPSVHNAPPIVAIAIGENLAVTLGLNLVPLGDDPGNAIWSGHFKPTNVERKIPYLEALTWNPRRINLLSPQTGKACWGCGRSDAAVVGPIIYNKNEDTTSRKGKGTKTIPFDWEDPAAFYAASKPGITVKSGKEEMAVSGQDLTRLLHEKDPPRSVIVESNPSHRGWRLIIPCTNPANNKTYDHRAVDFTGLSRDDIRMRIPGDSPDRGAMGVDGWMVPHPGARSTGCTRFVSAAARLLTPADWDALSAAAFQPMNASPAAFDVLSGLLWSLRRKVPGLPSRNVAWLMLKLMASAPLRARTSHPNAVFCPLMSLPVRQPEEQRKGTTRISPYPVGLPHAVRLEAELRRAISKNLKHRKPERIDWAGLCHTLNQLLD